MSREGFVITCTNCSYSGSDLVADGIFYYLMPFGMINVPRSLGWCFNCKGVSPIEVISYEERLESVSWLLKKTQRDLKNHEKEERKIKRWFLALAGRKKNESEELYKLRKLEDYLKNELSSPAYLLQFFSSNRPPRCLNCGSQKVEKIPRIYPSMEDSEKKMDEEFKIGFKHPFCGGDIKASKSGIRFNLRYEEKVYSPDGFRIKSN